MVGGVIVWTMFVCNTFACIPADDRPAAVATNFSGRGSDQTELANQSSFVITGAPRNRCHPGRRIPLDLRLQNTNSTSMSVTTSRSSSDGSMPPTPPSELPCLVEDFTVEQAPDGIDLTLPPRATSSLSGLSLPGAQWPQVGLRNTSVNQDGCKGASLTLEFSASGEVDE